MRDCTGVLRPSMLVMFCAAVILPVAAAAPTAVPPNDDKPSVKVSASPAMGFAPARVVLTADIRGGSDDYEEFYCATIEWEISAPDIRSDDIKSELEAQCDPYQAGKSEIKRRYVREQIFRAGGDYRVKFRLKQKDKVVGAATTTIRIRSGLGDGWSDR